MAIIKIKNQAIDLDAAEIPNIDASKITSGSIASARLGNIDLTNLSASNLTSGTIPDARVSSSAVSQHATSFDDNAIVNDLSTIALRQATNENAVAYNTNSSFVDVFQDATGIDTTTDAVRNASEYVSAIANVDTSITIDNSNYTTYIAEDPIVHKALTQSGWNPAVDDVTNITDYSIASNRTVNGNGLGTKGANLFASHGASNANYWTISNNSSNSAYSNYYFAMIGLKLTQPFAPRNFGYTWRNGGSGAWNTQMFGAINESGIANYASDMALLEKSGYSDNTAYTSNTTTNTTKANYLWLSQFHLNATNDYMLDTLNISGLITSSGVSATGNFIGNTITAPSSTSSMGAIITYQDQAGTNALNTDIVLQLSADNGSNFTTATLTALPNYSTGIKMAKVNDLAVTAGTQLKYKISFANQSGSKEARIRGVSLQY